MNPGYRRLEGRGGKISVHGGTRRHPLQSSAGHLWDPMAELGWGGRRVQPIPVPAKSLCMSVRKMPSFPVLGARALVRATLGGMCQGCQHLPTSDVPGTVGSLPSV